MRVLATNSQNRIAEKHSVLQERYEDILNEMNNFRVNLTKKIQVFEETKDDLIKEANDLETITKDKRTWVAEIEAREAALAQRSKELEG